jgi:dynein heavy chain
MIQVNFDPDLLLLLREIHYLASPPFNVRLPDPVRVLLRSTDDGLLRSTAARLDTIVSRYNSITATMESFEKPLFEQKMAKIEEVKLIYRV